MEPKFSLYEHPVLFPEGFNEQFLSLTFDEDEGMMRSDFMFWKNNLHHYYGFVTCLHQDGKVIGWALMMEYCRESNNYNYYCFIRPEFRGMGYGKRLLQETMKVKPKHRVYEEISLYAWDLASKCLYESEVKTNKDQPYLIMY